MGKQQQDDERARRLAEALRQNLRRRKAQARERDAGAPDGADTGGTDPDGDAPPAGN